ncbi:MAG TPA: tetratricopeptide repeat protein [Chthonomonadaceae bacterium]|nr:tetratricopeptide repeat protein [Chthonomonadaceae bacterium]
MGETKPMVSQMNPLLERGISYKMEGRYEEAIAEFRQLLLEDPNSSDGHHQLGLVYGFTGMFDESIEELLHAVRLAPTRNEIRNDLALTYSMLSMIDEAKSEFEEVLRRDPNNKRALENMEFLSKPS